MVWAVSDGVGSTEQWNDGGGQVTGIATNSKVWPGESVMH